MLNPINHTRTPAGVAKYKGEPYVMAADVYDTDGHRGRAGWTWYTGSAGWMYQAAIVHLLGMRIERGALSIYPCVPDDFSSYSIEYKKDGAQYIITVDVTPGYQGSAWLRMDGGPAAKSLQLDKKDGVHRIDACWQT
jgi:cellobiose phosphorylase